ncbi:MAG: hypothetical protein HYZ26_07145 [Chloroflexi bacterium]|nr:hypothetical protein [Chloroflexota bacterium]
MRVDKNPLVGLVGPCKSGKTRLKLILEEYGFLVRHIAQEHSFAPSMWQKIARPDVLIFLDADYEATVRRGQRWTAAEYLRQSERLVHARAHADLIVETSNQTENEVLAQVLKFLEEF